VADYSHGCFALGVVVLEVIDKNVSDLIPYVNNARTHSDSQITQIASSIKEFGFTQPVLIDGENGIIAGHGRVLAAQKLNMLVIPTIELKNLTKAQKKAYILADNKLALNSGWDDQLLSMELAELKDLGFDMDLTGFMAEEIEALSFDEPNEGLTDPDDVPDVPEEPITKLGDIWLLGEHRVMCGDSTLIDDVERLMDGKKADMVFCDPPYGINVVTNNKIGGGGNVATLRKNGTEGNYESKNYAEISNDDSTETAKQFYQTCISLGFENYIIFGGNYFTDFLKPSPCWIIWDKQNSGNFADVEMAWCSESRGAKLYSFTWNGMSRQGDHKTELSTRVHPTQKPVGLFIKIFEDFKFESCLDGFLGSGSTLIAAEKTNRICYGMEISPAYIQVILDRWANFTGKEPIRDDGVKWSELKLKSSL
jgi:DNA modification methylase